MEMAVLGQLRVYNIYVSFGRGLLYVKESFAIHAVGVKDVRLALTTPR